MTSKAERARTRSRGAAKPSAASDKKSAKPASASRKPATKPKPKPKATTAGRTQVAKTKATTRRARATGTSGAHPLSRVLVAVDLERGSDAALERAAHLPLAPGASVTLLSVLPRELGAAARKQLKDDAQKQLERAAERLQKSAHKAGSSELKVTAVVSEGQPFVELIRHAREREAELIVLGKHSPRPLRDLLVGSTANKVIRHGDVPVLVVGHKPTSGYRRPLFATALDDASVRTLTLLRRVLGPETTSGAVVHAFNAPFSGFAAPRAGSEERFAWQEQFRGPAEKELSAFVARHQEPGFTWEPVLRPGDPRAVLAAESARVRADIVALGTHARSGLAHVLLGSVAEWLVENAPCDVLIARPTRFSFELP